MKVDKIFQGLQTRGPNAGRPAIFISLSRANEMDKNEIIEIIKSFSPTRLLVVTGEEPLLQMHDLSGETNKSLLYMIRKDERLSIDEVEIETEGLIMPDANTYWNADFITVIPKVFTDESAKKLDKFLGIVGDISSILLRIGDEKDLEMKVDWIKNKVKTGILAQDIFLIPTKLNYKIMPLCISEGFRFNLNWNIEVK